MKNSRKKINELKDNFCDSVFDKHTDVINIMDGAEYLEYTDI